MGQYTLIQDYRPGLHVLCARVLIAVLILGIVAIASQHWLAAPQGWGSGGEEGVVEDGGYQGQGNSSSAASSFARHVKSLDLWTACFNHLQCASIPSEELPDAYDPVRVMVVIALGLHVVCVMVGLWCCCQDPDNMVGVPICMARLEESLAVVAGILMGGVLVMFAQITRQHPVYRFFHLDWSFWLMLFYVCCLLLAGGGIALSRYQCARRKRMCACCSKTCSARKRNTRRHIRAARLDHPVANNGFVKLLKEEHFQVLVETVNASNKNELMKSSI